MEARLQRCASAALILLLVSIWAQSVFAAAHRTRNFVVSAPTQQLAQDIGESAERWRRALAIEWIGEEMPAWTRPCPITAQVAPGLGAGGETSFIFDRGEVFGWRMRIQGSRERILDSVLPHEITHTILACYFRRPLPRWADEGACTTVENPSQIAIQERMLINFLKTEQGIPFRHMFAMKEYPPNVLPLYAQGHSLANMLIQLSGRGTFLNFLSDGMERDDWTGAVRKHYGHESLAVLQQDWLSWVKQGRPPLGPGPNAATQVASLSRPAPGFPSSPGSSADTATGEPVFRGQSPEHSVWPVSTATPMEAGSPVTTQGENSGWSSAAGGPQPIYDASSAGRLIRR